MCVEKQETITGSRSQIDPQTYVNILERLVNTTAVAVENIPVFLDLLDQPVNDPTVRPSNIEKWKELLHTTLGLLGDLSTFSDSAARTIARSVLFCYDGNSADEQLCRKLIHHFDDLCSGQTSKHKSLNSLFAPYLRFNRESDPLTLQKTIAFLEPSQAADAELLWMVNTIHNSFLFKAWSPYENYKLREIFVAVLTYVSCTEQSRRSQVPLTAAVIYAMHAMKSARDKDDIRFMTGPYVLPGTVLTRSESMCFHQVDTLDLWSDDCIQLASALLQPNLHWHGCHNHTVCSIQLALIAALYIDSTKQGGKAAATFAKLLKATSIPVIHWTSWAWADAYDSIKLAGYWYMALFQKPLYDRRSEKSPFQDIRDIITQTIEHCSEMRLSTLHLIFFGACARTTVPGILFFYCLYNYNLLRHKYRVMGMPPSRDLICLARGSLIVCYARYEVST